MMMLMLMIMFMRMVMLMMMMRRGRWWCGCWGGGGGRCWCWGGAVLHGNLHEKWPRTPPGTSFFLRACAVEMHMDISQEPFCREIYRKNAERAGYNKNTYRKNSSVWRHGLGKNINLDLSVDLDSFFFFEIYLTRPASSSFSNDLWTAKYAAKASLLCLLGS